MEIGKIKYLALVFFLSVCSFMNLAQKAGEYMSAGDPVDNLWESADGAEEGAPLVGGESQQFFFLIPDGSEESMMAPFEMEDMGFGCPTYFTISLDKKFLYLEINNSCVLNLSEEERFVKVRYKVNKDETILTLTVDGVDYDYKKWSYE